MPCRRQNSSMRNEARSGARFEVILLVMRVAISCVFELAAVPQPTRARSGIGAVGQAAVVPDCIRVSHSRSASAVMRTNRP